MKTIYNLWPGKNTSGLYNKKVAYFSMEIAVDQALKTYSGGLGYLTGSHMISAYDLKANTIGISILWTNGYYTQNREYSGKMRVDLIEHHYSFLHNTGITFTVNVHGHEVIVKVLMLHPETFGTAPVFFLTTDIPENDYLSRTITHRLYDPSIAARIAQSVILG